LPRKRRHEGVGEPFWKKSGGKTVHDSGVAEKRDRPNGGVLGRQERAQRAQVEKESTPRWDPPSGQDVAGKKRKTNAGRGGIFGTSRRRIPVSRQRADQMTSQKFTTRGHKPMRFGTPRDPSPPEPDHGRKRLMGETVLMGRKRNRFN